MTTPVKFGLIAGGVGAIINICVSIAIGICGPIFALLVGGVAGFLTVREDQPMARNEGARLGGTSGLIAGGLTTVGQIIGTVGTLIFFQTSGTQPLFGELPSPGDPGAQAIFLGAGIGAGLCFGLIGAVLAAGAGAGIGYLTTNETSIIDSDPLN